MKYKKPKFVAKESSRRVYAASCPIKGPWHIARD